MENIIKILLKNSPHTYILPSSFNADTWQTFKRDYSFVIENLINKAISEGRNHVTIFIKQLPSLSDNIKELKSFMCCGNYSENPTVIEWNQRRDEAKNFFTGACISELDGLGFIKKVLNVKIISK